MKLQELYRKINDFELSMSTEVRNNLICRTQGLPLRFKEKAQQFLDICPLNESALAEAQATDMLNLDLLNLILSGLVIEAAQDQLRDRVSLMTLRNELLQEISNFTKGVSWTQSPESYLAWDFFC